MDNLRIKALEILQKKYFVSGNGKSVSGQTHLMLDAMIEFLIASQPEELERLSSAEKVWYQTTETLNNKIKELERELKICQNNFNGVMQEIGEKEVLAEAFDRVQRLFDGKHWITEGRGPYDFNDEEYRNEVKYLLDQFDEIRKETWSNIRTKTFDYKKKIMDAYKSELKDECEAYRKWVHEFQFACLKEFPDLKEILTVAHKIKYGHPFPAETKI